MARSLDDVITGLSAERQAEVTSRYAELRDEAGLAALRKAAGLGQADVADALGIRQPSVSKIERQADMNISTLRDYVGAVGGELDLVVRLPAGKSVTLQLFDSPAQLEASAGAARKAAPTKSKDRAAGRVRLGQRRPRVRPTLGRPG
jgi:transcriptional regulator with XRE-family HTH domain